MSTITPAHWHLLLNHLPVEGLLFALLLLLYAFVRRNAELKRASLIAFILVGICAYLADTTGGGAARAIRHQPGVNKADVSEHIASAEYALITSEVLGAFALVGLILALRRKRATIEPNSALRDEHYKEPHTWVLIVCLILGLFDMAVVARTANLGGEIRHPEIKAGFQPAVDTSTSGNANASATAPAK